MKKKFSITDRFKSLAPAFSGLYYFFRNDHNGWVHSFATIVVVGLGIGFDVNRTEWMWLTAAIFSVFITEMLNTAIEKVVDKASPEKSELAKQSKDIAAAAVLMAAVFSVIIGSCIFYPYLATWIGSFQ